VTDLVATLQDRGDDPWIMLSPRPWNKERCPQPVVPQQGKQSRDTDERAVILVAHQRRAGRAGGIGREHHRPRVNIEGQRDGANIGSWPGPAAAHR
jgi:hypothetical protein